MFGLLKRSDRRPPKIAGEPTASFDIFISYARQDAKAVERIEQRLREWGWDIWRDDRLENGVEFERSILGHLERSKSVLVLWSPHAIASEWVKREAALAVRSGKLFHALLADCSLPGDLGRHHYNNLKDWDGNPGDIEFSSLLNQIAKRVGPKQRHAGTLLMPLNDQRISDDHIGIVHSSWTRPDQDEKFDGTPMFQIHLMLVGQQGVLDRVEMVIYYLDPTYRKSGDDNDAKYVSTDRSTNFSIYELANGYSLVRADVKIKGQKELVGLSRLVNLHDTGPRLKEQFISKQGGAGADPDRA